MTLEEKFLKALFLPFFCGIIFCLIIVTYFLFRFSYKCLDIKTYQNVIDTEQNKSHINIMTINNLVTRSILQAQIILEQGYSLYQYLVETTDIESILNETTIVNGYYLSTNYSSTIKNKSKNETAIWYINNQINSLELLKEKNYIAYLQLSIVSQSIHLLYSIYIILQKYIDSIYYVFDDTELFISYPIFNQDELIASMNIYENNPIWCTDEGGEIKKYYFFKCREWYKQYTKFIENEENENKSYIIIPPYNNINSNKFNSFNNFVLTICKRFIDPITKKYQNINSYNLLCIDIYPNDLFNILDDFNIEFRGHFLIADVGYPKPFYFPKIMQNIKNVPISDYEFNWDDSYYLEEKINFTFNITPIITKDYMKQINNIIKGDGYLGSKFFELSIELNNSFFYKKGTVINYSLYPILMNLGDSYQHILSIIFIYNKENFFDHLYSYQKKYQKRLYIEIILFIFFGFVLLALIRLSMNSLAKFIKIPIKHVQYMLKGINIGGENRLEYLNSLLNEKNDENSDNLNFINFLNSGDSDDDENNFNKIQLKYKKENIKKENHFFDFDEQLLQYRPKEINSLVKTLLELKNTIILASSNNKNEKIINYSTSENIFYKIKNREGIYICQSNIGNLEFQIFNYDKAIYHLCLSLQNPKLKKFISKTITDELDINNYLLKLIDSTYNKDYKEEFTNILVKKQQNSLHTTFSQRIIGNIINNRYNKLIHFYYKFFSLLQKSTKKYEELSGLFMHTSYHTINYYHKIIIQYIFLCYSSNDLIKIGESILDYIEFLLKFKLKTDKNNMEYLNRMNESIPLYKEKQNIKKIYFDKIIDWFDLFDHYINYVYENTTLGSDKTLIDAFVQTNSNNINDFNSQSGFLFKVHIQRSDFLRGKFALICHDYTEAIYYFIKSSKSKTVVLDGLIKKKSLKHLNKIAKKLKKKIIDDKLVYKTFDEDLLNPNVTYSLIDNSKIEKNDITYGEKIYEIMSQISKDIDECNIKQLKDILIIVDGINIERTPFETFIDETKTILTNYLILNDRFSMFIFNSKCRIVCPMMQKKKIDFLNLIEHIKDLSKKFEHLYNDSYRGSYIEEDDEKSDEEISSSVNNSTNKKINQMNLTQIISSLNYCINYLLLKGVENNEKFLLFFTNLFSRNDEYYYISENFINEIRNIKKDKNINLIIVGKYKDDLPLAREKSNIISNLFNGFGEKSEFVNSENMIKIKSILSCNNITNEKIFFPNELYQSNK